LRDRHGRDLLQQGLAAFGVRLCFCGDFRKQLLIGQSVAQQFVQLDLLLKSDRR